MWLWVKSERCGQGNRLRKQQQQTCMFYPLAASPFLLTPGRLCSKTPWRIIRSKLVSTQLEQTRGAAWLCLVKWEIQTFQEGSLSLGNNLLAPGKPTGMLKPVWEPSGTVEWNLPWRPLWVPMPRCELFADVPVVEAIKAAFKVICSIS